MTLTIIHRTTAYVDYPFEAISPAVLTELQAALYRLTQKKYKEQGMNLLRCLECYLQVTEQQLDMNALKGTVFSQISNLFKQLQHELRGGASPIEISERLDELIDAFDADLDQLHDD